MLRGGSAIKPASLRFRISVHLVVLLMLCVSNALATHHHGPWTGGTTAQASPRTVSVDTGTSNDSEPGCPLCMVGQSTMPTFALSFERLSFSTEPLCFCLEATEPRGFWSYDLFSRPPPPLESIAV